MSEISLSLSLSLSLSCLSTPSASLKARACVCLCRHMKDEQSKEIEDSVLDRCILHGGVVHIFVDRRSPFVSTHVIVTGKGSALASGKGSILSNTFMQGCVYLKMDSVDSAVKAYKALHGGWYKGKIERLEQASIESVLNTECVLYERLHCISTRTSVLTIEDVLNTEYCVLYTGKLVTAKYIPLEKYHKWFIGAATAKKHIYPSS